MVGQGTPDAELPEIGTALAPVLAVVPRDQQPLLIAMAERSVCRPGVSST